MGLYSPSEMAVGVPGGSVREEGLKQEQGVCWLSFKEESNRTLSWILLTRA